MPAWLRCLFMVDSPVVGTCVEGWTGDRVRQAEQETEHYLHGTVTAARVKPLVRDEAALARREARVLEMAQAEFRERRRLG